MRPNKKTILVIEPKQHYQNFYKTILEAEDYGVIKATNIKEAVAKLFGEKLELVILDIDFPQIGGLKLLEIIRRHKKTKDIPLIMISSRFCEKDIRLSHKYGADLCMEKPSQIKDILGTVNCLLHKKHELVS